MKPRFLSSPFLLTLVALVTLVLVASCASLQENVDARKVLAHCTYEYSSVKLDGVTLSSVFLPEAADLVLRLKITNPTDTDAALDHAQLDFSLHGEPVFGAEHKKFARLKAGKSSKQEFDLHLPLSGLLSVGTQRPETLHLDAKLWLTVLIGSNQWETPVVVPVEFEVPLPWDEIDRAVAKKVKEAKNKAGKAGDNLLGKGKKP